MSRTNTHPAHDTRPVSLTEDLVMGDVYVIRTVLPGRIDAAQRQYDRILDKYGDNAHEEALAVYQGQMDAMLRLLKKVSWVIVEEEHGD